MLKSNKLLGIIYFSTAIFFAISLLLNSYFSYKFHGNINFIVNSMLYFPLFFLGIFYLIYGIVLSIKTFILPEHLENQRMSKLLLSNIIIVPFGIIFGLFLASDVAGFTYTIPIIWSSLLYFVFTLFVYLFSDHCQYLYFKSKKTFFRITLPLTILSTLTITIAIPQIIDFIKIEKASNLLIEQVKGINIGDSLDVFKKILNEYNKVALSKNKNTPEIYTYANYSWVYVNNNPIPQKTDGLQSKYNNYDNTYWFEQNKDNILAAINDNWIPKNSPHYESFKLKTKIFLNRIQGIEALELCGKNVTIIQSPTPRHNYRYIFADNKLVLKQSYENNHPTTSSLQKYIRIKDGNNSIVICDKVYPIDAFKSLFELKNNNLFVPYISLSNLSHNYPYLHEELDHNPAFVREINSRNDLEILFNNLEKNHNKP